MFHVAPPHRDVNMCSYTAHSSHTFRCSSNDSLFGGLKSHIVKKPQPFLCRSVIKEESLLRLGCLFQFQIQSFVLYCYFFSLWSRVTPLLAAYWLSPAGSSILIGWRAHWGGFGRFSFVYMLVEKTPITTVTFGNQAIHS